MTPKEAPKRKYSPLFALERIKNIPVHTTYSSFVKTYASTDYKDEIEVIEYALNRLKELESQQPIVLGGRMSGKQNIIAEKLQRLEELEKDLSIVFGKSVNLLDVSVSADYETYFQFFKDWNWNGEYDEFILTETEFNLLKEYLL